MKRILTALLVATVALTAILFARAATLRSRQVEVAPTAPIPIDEAGALERFSGALRIRTISYSATAPPEAEALRQFHAYLEQKFPLVHQRLRRETVGDFSLLYTWPGRNPQAKPIVLLSHMDVVPVEATSESRWTHPPFEGRIADGFLWGRGALDDKFGLMAILEAVEHLLSTGFQPAVTVHLAFGHDEEIHGEQGAVRMAALLASRGVQAEMVLDEGGSLVEGALPGIQAPVACVGTAEKGFLTVELIARIPGGHSSSPPPHTAIGLLATAIHKLERNQMRPALRPPVTEFIDHVGPETALPYRLALANTWLLGPLLPWLPSPNPALNATVRTTTAATIIEGGVKENVLPAMARAAVNFRILPGDTSEGVVQHVREVVADPNIEVSPLPGAREPSPISPTDSRGFDLLRHSIRAIYPGAVVAPYLSLGGTDSRHYAAISPNIYRFMPMVGDKSDLARLHGIDERTSVRNYVQAIRFFVDLIRRA